jgi:hypothetical protein
MPILMAADDITLASASARAETSPAASEPTAIDRAERKSQAHGSAKQ